MWEKKVFRSQGRAGTPRLGLGLSAEDAASDTFGALDAEPIKSHAVI